MVVGLLIGAAIAGLGVFFVLIGVRERRADRRFVARAERATATVTDVRWHAGPGQESGPLAYPVVRFALPDGREVETETRVGRSPAAARAGEQRTVLYDPGAPLDVQLEGGGTKLLGSIFVLVGTLIVLAGLATILVSGLILYVRDG